MKIVKQTLNYKYKETMAKNQFYAAETTVNEMKILHYYKMK
jgi:hypothetical protein